MKSSAPVLPKWISNLQSFRNHYTAILLRRNIVEWRIVHHLFFRVLARQGRPATSPWWHWWSSKLSSFESHPKRFHRDLFATLSHSGSLEHHTVSSTNRKPKTRKMSCTWSTETRAWCRFCECPVCCCWQTYPPGFFPRGSPPQNMEEKKKSHATGVTTKKPRPGSWLRPRHHKKSQFEAHRQQGILSPHHLCLLHRDPIFNPPVKVKNLIFPSRPPPCIKAVIATDTA